MINSEPTDSITPQLATILDQTIIDATIATSDSKCATCLPSFSDIAPAVDIATLIEEVIDVAESGPLQAGPQRVEQRAERRYPFPYPIRLIPVARHELKQVGEPIVVVGKHLSASGLDFYFNEPLPYRRMIASLPKGNESVHFLVDLKWCRFGTHGWYVNVGRFLRVMENHELAEFIP